MSNSTIDEAQYIYSFLVSIFIPDYVFNLSTRSISDGKNVPSIIWSHWSEIRKMNSFYSDWPFRGSIKVNGAKRQYHYYSFEQSSKC